MSSTRVLGSPGAGRVWQTWHVCACVRTHIRTFAICGVESTLVVLEIAWTECMMFAWANAKVSEMLIVSLGGRLWTGKCSIRQ